MKKENSDIKVFWFDLGNVIIPFDVNNVVKQLCDYTDKSAEEMYDIFFNSPIVINFSEGKISFKEFFKQVRNILNIDDRIKYKDFKDIWNSIFIKEDKNMVNLIAQLKEKYRIVIVSNINVTHYNYIKKKYKIMKEVKEQVLSFKVGADKPDIKIYNEAFKRTNAQPEEIIYIDDREDLIEEASNLGLNCIQYKGYKDLVEKLKESGIEDKVIF